MRFPVHVKKTGALQAIKMKQLSPKKKKKHFQDSISETISFVIKGKLTPVKPTVKKGTYKKSLRQKKSSQDCKLEDKLKNLECGMKVEGEMITKKKAGKSGKTADTPKKIAKAKTEGGLKKTEKKKAVKKTAEPKRATEPKRKSPPEAAKVKRACKTKTESPAKTSKKSQEVNSKKSTIKVLRETPKPSSPKIKKKLSTNAKTVKKTNAISKKPAKAKPPKKKDDESSDDSFKIKEEFIAADYSSTSEEPPSDSTSDSKSDTIKDEKTTKRPPKNIKYKTKSALAKKSSVPKSKPKRKPKDPPKKQKLTNLWNAPKRHRVASLNALAKVHCLYENESRSNSLDEAIKSEPLSDNSKDSDVPTRTLRSVPGLRAVGKHWDMDDANFSSSDESSSDGEKPFEAKPKATASDNSEEGGKKRKRNRTELIMDLKDMVVRKRMASLNATAILAASYSMEKRSVKSPKSEYSDSYDDSEDGFAKTKEMKKSDGENAGTEDDKNLIEVCATPNKKVAVILNQDTDVTITGVYVNSTTRSTHHEGYCSIAGMQYRISATSHTQTAATAVATETILQPSGNGAGQDNSSQEPMPPCKSYTPLGALSSMQPPGGGGGSRPQRGPQLPERQHGCSSAFSAPPQIVGHHHQPPVRADQGYMHGFYQPAGPLITVPHGHGHSQSTAIGKSGPEISPTISPLPPIHPPAPSSTGDSSDNEVIITSVTAAKDPLPPPPPPPPQQPQQQQQQPPPAHYRFGQYPAAHPGYPYAYPPQYYPAPHAAAAAYAHHDLCYSPSPYLHHKYPAHTSYRRYLPSVQYYQHGTPELYGPGGIGNQQSQQVVSANPASVSGAATFQPAAPPSAVSGAPPPTLLDTFPPPPAPAALVDAYPPPPHYYPGYGPAPPPPACYTHSPPTRSMPYINAATYQTCPCPMQSCPKNGLTGPLTGDSKRSNISSIAKESVPLPPVASLALPLEPASATGPPSPARGSAGMPPPPSPAGATYQSGATPKIESCEEKPQKKARIGKAMVRSNMVAAAAAANTMLLMCHPPVEGVKREVESPEETVEVKKPPSPDDLKAAIAEGVCKQCEVAQEAGQPMKEEEKEAEAEAKAAETEPCVATVAENVKVKNMKRKSEPKEPEVTYPPPKRQKVDKTKTANGSYKDLIKKNTSCVKINNGKRKLTVGDSPAKTAKTKKQTQKRKLSPAKEETCQKRLKTAKPLVASNLHNAKQNAKECKEKVVPETELTENKEPPKKTKKVAVIARTGCVVNDSVARTKCNKAGNKTVAKKNSTKTLKAKVECAAVTKRKYNKKNNTNNNVVPQAIAKVPRRSLQCPRWSNGWMWEGEPYEAKVFINSDEVTVTRKCYPRMRHKEGDLIEPRDCVLLKAGPRRNDLPFVAKVAALWESPEDGEMMMSLLWYYRPEHTEQGRQPTDQPDEVFASRHKDSNSVACIEDKCYVLTFNEYCRYRKNLRRLEEGIEDVAPCIPFPEPYPRMIRQPPSSVQTPADLVFFCRRVYDFRQKRIVKNPS